MWKVYYHERASIKKVGFVGRYVGLSRAVVLVVKALDIENRLDGYVAVGSEYWSKSWSRSRP